MGWSCRTFREELLPLYSFFLFKVTILTITTLAAPPNPENYSAAPIPPRATIYRSQQWNAY
jgi:hypothetical protein